VSSNPDINSNRVELKYSNIVGFGCTVFGSSHLKKRIAFALGKFSTIRNEIRNNFINILNFFILKNTRFENNCKANK